MKESATQIINSSSFVFELKDRTIDLRYAKIQSCCAIWKQALEQKKQSIVGYKLFDEPFILHTGCSLVSKLAYIQAKVNFWQYRWSRLIEKRSPAF